MPGLLIAAVYCIGDLRSGEFSADSKWITGASDDCTAIAARHAVGTGSLVPEDLYAVMEGNLDQGGVLS